MDEGLDRAERLAKRGKEPAAVAELEAVANKLDDSPGQQALAQSILDLAETLR